MTNAEICQAAQRELFGNAQLERADDLLAPDFVDHAAPPGAPQAPRGRQGHRAVAAQRLQRHRL